MAEPSPAPLPAQARGRTRYGGQSYGDLNRGLQESLLLSSLSLDSPSQQAYKLILLVYQTHYHMPLCQLVIACAVTKGAWIYILVGEEVVILIRVIEIYIRIPKNQLLVTIVEYIFANRKAILLLIIVKGVMVIASQFNKKMTSHKLVSVSNSRYTNEGIYIVQLDHFIKYNNYNLEGEQHILLINRATYYNTPNFRLKALANKIQIVKFLLY